ncbi:MAG: hypothetical protein WB988_17425 [Candidatus Nitrosopolaris sp.]
MLPNPKLRDINPILEMRIQFRISVQEYQVFSNICKLLYEQKAIKALTVSALARACLFSQINQWLAIQQKNAEIITYDKRMKELQATVARKTHGAYVPRL